MKPQKPAGPANMYFIAHVLPPHLDAEILLMKQDLHQRFGCAVGLKSPAHITLVPPFWLSPVQEELLLQEVRQLAQDSSPFSLATNNYASFGKRTLFIAITESQPLQLLKQYADKRFTGSDRYGLKKEHRPFHPHITLATRDIKPSDFEQAWQLYKDKIFVHEWQADGVSLLRHNRKNWDVILTAPMNAG